MSSLDIRSLLTSVPLWEKGIFVRPLAKRKGLVIKIPVESARKRLLTHVYLKYHSCSTPVGIGYQVVSQRELNQTPHSSDWFGNWWIQWDDERNSGHHCPHADDTVWFFLWLLSELVSKNWAWEWHTHTYIYTHTNTFWCYGPSHGVLCWQDKWLLHSTFGCCYFTPTKVYNNPTQMGAVCRLSPEEDKCHRTQAFCFALLLLLLLLSLRDWYTTDCEEYSGWKVFMLSYRWNRVTGGIRWCALMPNQVSARSRSAPLLC